MMQATRKLNFCLMYISRSSTAAEPCHRHNKTMVHSLVQWQTWMFSSQVAEHIQSQPYIKEMWKWKRSDSSVFPQFYSRGRLDRWKSDYSCCFKMKTLSYYNIYVVRSLGKKQYHYKGWFDGDGLSTKNIW